MNIVATNGAKTNSEKTEIGIDELDEVLKDLSEEKTAEEPLADGETERLICSAMLADEAIALAASKLLKASQFTNNAHKIIAEATFREIEASGSLPTFNEIKLAIQDKWKGSKSLPHYVGEANTCFEGRSRTFCDHRSYWLSLIVRLARDIGLKNFLKTTLQDIKTGKTDHWTALRECQQLFESLDAAAGAGEANLGYFAEECRSMPLPEPLVEDHLYKATLAMIFGDSGVGKTFFALDLACSVASGRDFMDKFRVEAGAVVYVCGEGSLGFNLRLRAWLQKFSEPLNRNLLVIPRPYDLCDEESISTFLLQVKAKLGNRKPVAVFFDTLNRNNAGDENSNKDVAKILASLSRIKDETGACVVTIHHTGKDAAKGARGHSSLRGDMDTHLRLEKWNDGIVYVSSDKSKDDGGFAPYLVELRNVELLDDDGDLLRDTFGRKVTSLVCVRSRMSVLDAKQQREESEQNEEYAQWLADFPAAEVDAVTVKELIDSRGLTEQAIGKRIRKLSAAGKLCTIEGKGHGAGRIPSRYYRSSAGNATVLERELLPNLTQLVG